MKSILNATALALILSVGTAHAQTTQPNPPTAAPNAVNSGPGIAGAPGSKNGPAAKPETTTGSNAQRNSTVQQQDPSTVKGLPGNKSGPAVKPPDRQ